ncbi:MAG: 4Fe-4S binding protein, partial [Clostridiales bacterium]
CNNCGRCLNQCPFGAIEDSPTLYKIFLGGRWGKQIRIGTALETLFSQEELLNMIEKAILLFKSQGLDGERFSSTIERIGLPETEK